MGFGDGSGISWTTCKQSAPHSRQITMITQFLQAGCSSWRPTNNVKALNVVATHVKCNKMSWNFYWVWRWRDFVNWLENGQNSKQKLCSIFLIHTGQWASFVIHIKQLCSMTVTLVVVTRVLRLARRVHGRCLELHGQHSRRTLDHNQTTWTGRSLQSLWVMTT